MGRHRKYPRLARDQVKGHLTVVQDYTNKHGVRFVLCKCVCGKLTRPRIREIYTNKNISCGCKTRKKRKHVRPPKIGTQFSRLTVVSTPRSELDDDGQLRDEYGHRAVMVRCSCGESEDWPVSIHYLLRGQVKSCGCLHTENAAKNLNHGQQVGKASPRYKDYTAMQGKYIACRSKLKFVEEAPTSKRNNGDTLRMGVFRCNCGREVTRPLNATFYNRTRTCGLC